MKRFPVTIRYNFVVDTSGIQGYNVTMIKETDLREIQMDRSNNTPVTFNDIQDIFFDFWDEIWNAPSDDARMRRMVKYIFFLEDHIRRGILSRDKDDFLRDGFFGDYSRVRDAMKNTI